MDSDIKLPPTDDVEATLGQGDGWVLGASLQESVVQIPLWEAPNANLGGIEHAHRKGRILTYLDTINPPMPIWELLVYLLLTVSQWLLAEAYQYCYNKWIFNYKFTSLVVLRNWIRIEETYSGYKTTFLFYQQINVKAPSVEVREEIINKIDMLFTMLVTF